MPALWCDRFPTGLTRRRTAEFGPKVLRYSQPSFFRRTVVRLCSSKPAQRIKTEDARWKGNCLEFPGKSISVNC